MTSCIIPTKGSIDDMVWALCQHAFDSAASVKNTVNSSLLDIGRKQPNLVLSSCCEFLRKNNRIPTGHRILLLTVIKRVLELHRNTMAEALFEPLAELCLSDMTKDKSVIAEWQGAASAVIVSLGQRFPQKIMDKLMARFSPGQIPHYFIVFTLGDMAQTHPMAVVPQLKTVLARVIPILGSVKKDNIKWVFASTLYKFCDAVVSYVVNAQGNTVDNIDEHSFSGEIYPAYEIMFSNWIKSSEAKVRAVTIQAVGAMCAILTPSQFETELPKILAGVLALYKKDKNHYPVTIGLSVILNVACKADTRVLEPHLNTLFLSLHALACVPPNMNIAQSLDNYNELLRCFDIIGREYCDETLHFLLGRLDAKLSKTSQQRVGTLKILKHIVTRLTGDEIESNKPLLVNGLKPLLTTETVIAVRQAAAQLIICMCGHDYLSHEGGEVLIEFIVRQSSITDAEIAAYKSSTKTKKKGPAPALTDSPEELRRMCDNIMNLAATTIPCMEDVLWPFLLETIVPPGNIGAMAIVSKCIAFLGNKKRAEEEEDYLFDFQEFVNIPKPPELVVRLLVLLSYPLRRGKLGLHILQALHALGPVFDPVIGDMWDNTVPKLGSFLQSKSAAGAEQWDNKAWEDLVLRLLSETVKAVDDDEWTTAAAEALVRHFDGYKGDAELRKSCLKHLGLLLQKLSKKDFIKDRLDDMFAKLDHSVALEREGCAQGYGYCSASHLDMVLDKINSEANGTAAQVAQPASGGFMSRFFSSKPKGPTVEQLTTAMLCYGYVAAYSPPSLITTRVDVSVLSNMQPHMDKLQPGKQVDLTEAVITAIDLVGKAMHPDHLGGAYRLNKRNDLIKSLIQFMYKKKGKAQVSHNVRVLGLNAMATLIHLQPPLMKDLETDLVDAICTFYHVQASHLIVKQKASKKKDSKVAKSAAAVKAKHDAEEKAVAELITNLNSVLLSILEMDATISCLQRILDFLEPYTAVPEPYVRERVCMTILALLKKYIELKSQHLNESAAGESSDEEEEEEGVEEDKETKKARVQRRIAKKRRRKVLADSAKDLAFGKVGYYLAMIIPRCTDSVEVVRQTCIEVTGLMLYVDHVLRSGVKPEGQEEDPEVSVRLRPPEALRPINSLRERIKATEINAQYAVVQELSGVISALITPDELLAFLKRIMRALLDVELCGACGACVVLNGIIKRRGEELEEKVAEVVHELITEMVKIKSDQTLNATLHAIRNLALHHRVSVFDTLLEAPLPHSPEVIKSFQVLAKDDDLVVDLLNHLTNILNNQLLMEDKSGSKSKSKKSSGGGKFKALAKPLAATAALGEIMDCKEMAEVVQKHYARFVCTLLLRFGTSNGMPDAMKIAVVTFKQFLACAKETETIALMDANNNYAKLESKDFYRAIAVATSGFARSHPTAKADIYKFLFPYLKGNYPGQRVVSAAVLGELVNHTKDTVLLQNLLNALILNLSDAGVKLQCLIGLGNIASAGKVEVDKYATTVLGALLASIDGNDAELAMESMNGLSKVFEVVDEAQVAPSLINLCLRIQPSFETKAADMRAAAFQLFGTMSRFGSHEFAQQVFLEQVHKLLPCLVMHSNDEDEAVSKACRRALRRFAPLLGDRALEQYLTSPVTAEDASPSSQDYDEFLDSLGKLLISAFPDRMNYYVMTTIEYFKSDWTQLRGNATTQVGFILHHLNKERRQFLNVPMITQALISMLKQKSADVRRRTASTMGLLYEY